MLGIECEPKNFDPDKPGVLLLNSGVIHHIGACRLSVKLARRIAEASGGDVLAVHQITPADYSVDLWFDDPERMTTIHVIPEGTVAEAAWCELVMNGEVMVDWADLRWPHRMVLRGAA